MNPLAFHQLVDLERDHWWFRGRRAVCLGLIEDLVRDSPPARVLDLGAGAGGFLEPLGKIGTRVLHTESDAEMIAACRARGFHGGVRACGESLPFVDGCFDLVCLFDVIEHVERDDGAMAEIRRVLRPGGHVFLHVPAHPWLYAENDRIAGHHRRYTRRSMRALLEGADLEVVRNTYTNALLFPLIAPAVLALKLLERTGLMRGHTNLSWTPPGPLQRAFFGAFRSELSWSRRVDLPLGHSIAAIGRRTT